MHSTHIIARYGELFLKGKNRSLFERKLVANIKKITLVGQVDKVQGKVVIPYFSGHKRLTRVFGLVSYSLTVRVEKRVEKIQEIALQLLEGKNGTFKVESKRGDKQFELTSPQLDIAVGKWIEEHSTLKFKFEHPDTVVNIEVNQEGAYVFTESFSCFGGLPTGVEGTVMVFLEDEASVLAGLLLMRRGCSVFPVSIGEERDISLLQEYSPSQLELRQFRNLAEIEKFALSKKIFVMVCGQRFEDFKKYDTSLVVLRPLVGYSEEDVQRELQKYKEK
ncbi:TPA: hypothetical protein HA242_02355 [Candidatus Woesearchaeota archaeon]|nr:hypothetical protein [Candidatus Woesearchaeota archaeon]HIH12542.1 hypothetical protein [Candidatus Woesearchaeota archaeon]